MIPFTALARVRDKPRDAALLDIRPFHELLAPLVYGHHGGAEDQHAFFDDTRYSDPN